VEHLLRFWAEILNCASGFADNKLVSAWGCVLAAVFWYRALGSKIIDVYRVEDGIWFIFFSVKICFCMHYCSVCRVGVIQSCIKRFVFHSIYIHNSVFLQRCSIW